MKKKILIAVCFSLVYITSFSQYNTNYVEHEVIADAEKGYYIKNSVLYDGIWILKENKSGRARRVVIPQQMKHEAQTLYPTDIEEYGFPNGIKYVSAKINFGGLEVQVFLDEFISINDEVIFFVYSTENKEDIFFILEGEENILRQIDTNTPKEVWDIFKSLNDCSEVEGLEPFPRKLTRKRVNVFYSAYRDCNPNLFPKFQYGPVLNLGIGKPKTNEVPAYVYSFNIAFTAGGFVQIPFDECTSLRTEILYSLLNNRGNIGAMQKKSDSEAQYLRHSIQMPLLVRYSFNFNPWKNVPYFELGPCFDYAFYGGKLIDGELQKPEEGVILDSSMIKFQYCYSVGTGIEHKISHNKTFHLGLRYNWFTGARQEYVEKMQFIGISAAINL